MSCKDKKIYITTPIYYVNDIPHIGHAYTTMIADTLARYSRLVGYDTFFLTGTDEHGQKIEESAKKRGKSSIDYADEISSKFRELWDEFEISYDKFIRTTDKEHIAGVQKAFLKMFENGDIYKGEYEGHYCVSCETFFQKRQLVDEEFCPECGKETRIVQEESYFFKLSSYQDRLLKWYEQNPNCILPKTKRNEIINFVKDGLNDLSITRTSFDWGIKLPESINSPKHVIYVWLDALFNYVTALGYGDDDKDMRYWPAKIHLLGKDILRFHAIYWPAFLMSVGLPLPTHIAAHGWWTRNGEKMSKSVGNVINPKEVADAYGLENFRYFMLREVPFGQDGDFSQKALIDRLNSDLSNDLGNLLNRIIGMSNKYFEGRIDSSNLEKYHLNEIKECEEHLLKIDEFIYEMQLNRYLEELWKPLSLANQSITIHEPWVKIKEGRNDEAMALIALVANILVKVSILLHPVMPKTTSKIAEALSVEIDTQNYNRYINERKYLDEFVIKDTPPLFPRIDEPLMKSESQPPKKEQKIEEMPKISIDDFFKCELKIGTIIEAKEAEKSKKLLILQVDLGEEKPRQIVAGIKEFYCATSLVGTQVVVVANLKPAKIMGMLSEGMVLASKDKSSLSLLRVDGEKESGSKVC